MAVAGHDSSEVQAHVVEIEQQEVGGSQDTGYVCTGTRKNQYETQVNPCLGTFCEVILARRQASLLLNDSKSNP